MELRPELMPPALNEQLVARLAKLAAHLDGDPDEDMRAEFNRLAGTDIPIAEFTRNRPARGHALARPVFRNVPFLDSPPAQSEFVL